MSTQAWVTVLLYLQHPKCVMKGLCREASCILLLKGLEWCLHFISQKRNKTPQVAFSCVIFVRLTVDTQEVEVDL